MARWIIYSLRRGKSDPFYVGTTRCNWRQRLKNHKIRFGKSVILDILEEGDGDQDAAERYWIKNYRQRGYPLVNKTDGGYSQAPRTIEHKIKIGKAHKGKVVSERTRAILAAIAREQFATPEARRIHSQLMMTKVSKERRSEIGRMGAAALRKKYPVTHHIFRFRIGWAVRKQEERAARMARADARSAARIAKIIAKNPT